MGDEMRAMVEKYNGGRLPPDLDKARAERRANVAQDIRDGLVVEAPAARNSDPDTSHAAIAYLRSSGTRATHQKIVLDMVHRLPGLTFVELAKQCGIEKHEVMKRLNDLRGEAPPLVKKGAVRSAPGQRAACTWWPA